MNAPKPIQSFILASILFLSSNTYGENTLPYIPKPNNGLTTDAVTADSAVLISCGKMPDGTELKHAIIGNKLYILENSTLHRYLLGYDSLVLWESSCRLYTDTEHKRFISTDSNAFSTIQVSGNDVSIRSNGITHMCSFEEELRGLRRRNRIPVEAIEARRNQYNHAEQVLEVYKKSLAE